MGNNKFNLLYSPNNPRSGGTIYSYLIVNSSYAQTGNCIYNSNQVWVPLALLDTYNTNNNKYTYSNLNYNPYQYPTLEIGAGLGLGVVHINMKSGLLLDSILQMV